MLKLAPSILSSNFANLKSDILAAEAGGADILHLDIMDGHFVPNISFGAPLIKSIRSLTNMPFDVHLMIENPELYINSFVDAGADIITVHKEACVHLHRVIQQIKSYGIKAGVALNPATPLEEIQYVLNDIDMILIMTVNPGFGGQTLIRSMEEKVRKIKRIIEKEKLNIDIEIDGGIKLDNVEEVIDWGANIIVAGSAVFNTEDITLAVNKFKDIMSLQ